MRALKTWFLRTFCGFYWRDVTTVETDGHGFSRERTRRVLVRDS